MMSLLRLAGVVVGIVALNVALTAWASQQVRLINGVPYRFPAAVGVTGTVLLNDGAGGLSWVGVGVPTGITAWSVNGTCPSGWSEVTSARGRYPVGLVEGGTLAATVGTALTDTENRAVGTHNHTLSDPQHTHGQTNHGHTVSDPGHAHTLPGSFPIDFVQDGGNVRTVPSGSTTTTAAGTGITLGSTTATNNAATTGITVQNAGSVAGTNAPSRQMPLCSKD